MGDTSQILTQINGIMNIKEMQGTMKDIQKSMMQFGIINEMVDDAMGTMDDDMDDMEDTDLDRIIDSVKNPEKYKNTNNNQQQQQQIQNNDVDDLEAKLKALSWANFLFFYLYRILSYAKVNIEGYSYVER